MSSKSKHPLWSFLASVRLALILIALLASTSIIGTLIQQNKPPEHYVEQHGASWAQVIQQFNLNNMYNSVWFLTILAAFVVNLTVCSLDRLPVVIRLVNKDNLDTDPEHLCKMKMQHQVDLRGGSVEGGVDQATRHLAGKGWQTERRQLDKGILLFAQKGALTRYGVYIVHISIIVIIAAAVIGHPTFAKKILRDPNFAFKGGVLLPERAETGRIFSHTDESEILLGFTVRCDFFEVDFYTNGMPKSFVSGLTILENEQEVLRTTIEVNKPLTYKGVTFYQSSYNQLRQPIIRLKNLDTEGRKIFPVNPDRWNVSYQWEDGNTQGMLRILDARTLSTLTGKRTELDIWLMDSQGGEPSMLTVPYDRPIVIERPGTNYEFRIGPHYATGLQVAKDPGVLWVYIGFVLMLLGLYPAFFMSHRKIWVYVDQNEGTTRLLFAGSSNKHASTFEKTFAALTADFQQEQYVK